MDFVIRIGTRGSLLALAQTRRVATALEARVPGLRCELVPIETRGDKRVDLPLSAVADDQFFSAELDEALAAGHVHLCVHSLKDLGSARPFHQIIVEREETRDVVLFRDDVPRRLAEGLPITLGTSTPRRAENVADFLAGALPRGAVAPQLRFTDIRGAVDRRLQRLHGDGALQGTVLALAGLNRLWRDPEGQRVLAPLLAGLRWMVLPLEACPAAPGQAALVVECRSDDHETRALLEPLHRARLAELIELERSLIEELPAADRGAFGATAVEDRELGAIAWLRGRRRDAGGEATQLVERLHWLAPPRPEGARPWEGSQWRARAGTVPVEEVPTVLDSTAIFVAHSRAFDGRSLPDARARIWAAGVSTWRSLAARGLWVEGCAEVLGFEALRPTLSCEVLRLPPLKDWLVLTHSDAVEGWPALGVNHVQPTYRIEPPHDPDQQREIAAEVAAASHFFWSSGTQYQGVKDWLPPDAQHACGPGKTARELRAAGVQPLSVFPSAKEWRAWLA